MGNEGNPEGKETGGGTGAPAWLAQLPQPLKDNAALTGYKTIGDMAQAHLDLTGKVADLEGVKAKFDALPKPPGKPEEYLFDKTDGIDEGMLNEARPQFLKAGLTADQAKAMVALEGSIWQKRVDAFAAQSEKDRVAAEAALKTEWGADYGKKTENMRRFLETFSKGFKVNGQPADVTAFLDRTRLGNDPFFIRFVDALASKFPEDSSPSGGSAGQGDKKGMIALYNESAKP